MPGTIKDPRMNPISERDFGTVFRHDDSHSYVYIKTDKDGPNVSRYFTEGTEVELGYIFPAFLVIPEMSQKELDNYQKLNFKNKSDLKEKLLNFGKELGDALVKCELSGMMSVKTNWKEEPVIFDLIDIKKEDKIAENQPVINELNEKAREILNRQ